MVYLVLRVDVHVDLEPVWLIISVQRMLVGWPYARL